MIGRLKILKESKGQFPNNGELTLRLKTDQAFRKEIETLSKAFLSRTVSGCSSCYSDAYLELISLPIEKAMEKEQCQFSLRRGKLLRDVVNYDVSLNMTQANITNDLALYHLKTNPRSVEYFETLPKDWEKQVKAYVLPGEEKEDPDPVTEKKKKVTRKKAE